ncbi:CaiB/BaiF CoA transferase family protein [Amycolatopsis jiangsuensis]|uniref:Crotonobetainyl-CoA:carnitine CoA-transferase CaiB-like acyl-CoA transferase n=1 Tax=Amycolatopsis jiangsuensis TaxID=1181879 RepID=A0A840J7B8_9PSEU|nr:CaiB/BaiF CoA-transferase family protein [Amycolatopsis jiangsuensis]MBB4689288.1 crotonobetainyl-CoA:carnitine CoA-transferase CaiB-like acyl-CoA transferase [Amycolatopsis jiangsuensis]
MLPLEGTTVVALEQAVAAPFATRQLADLGARVIKVERPGAGDFSRGYDRTVHGDSSYFVWLNRGKESIELDIKDADDRRVLDAMIAAADVVIQNLAPGAVGRLGLDAATLRAARPDLVHCSISGYGPGGPYQPKKAYDLLIQCEAGLVTATGTPEQPSKAGVSIADIATGMYAYSGVLTALLRRATEGAGATIEVAMIDALAEWMVQPAYHAVYGGAETRRTGAKHASIAPYGPYRAGDGNQVFLAVQSDREWVRLCREVLRRPDLADDPRFVHNPERVAHDCVIGPLIESAFAAFDADRVVALLDSAGIACARLRRPGELFDHPQFAARDRTRQVRAPGGVVQALLPPADLDEAEPVLGPVPRLGEHNDALRVEFGFRREEVTP